MLRVAHLLPNMIAGGRERIVAQLCDNAAGMGIEPHLITYDPEAPGQRFSLAGVPVHAIDRQRVDFVRALGDMLQANRIDVLHAQGHVAAAIAAPVGRAVPMVVTLHAALGSGWRWAPAMARGLRAATAITAVSHDLAGRYRWLAGRPIATILPGIALPPPGPAQPARPVTPFTIGIAARLHPVKRHRDALAALAILGQQGVPCRLAFAGQGPMEAELRARSAGLDVRFDGHVDDMAAWFAGIDAFLLPSDHEGTPLALLEACAAGLPCIATRVGGIPAAVGDAALLVPRRDPPALAAAINRLVAAPELRAALSGAARARAEQLSLDQALAQYREVYATCQAASARQSVMT